MTRWPAMVFPVLIGACSSADEAPGAKVEKRCGTSSSQYLSFNDAESIARYSGCTTILGRIQEDSVTGLADLRNLTTIAALASLKVVTGKVYIRGNDRLPQADADALVARLGSQASAGDRP